MGHPKHVKTVNLNFYPVEVLFMFLYNCLVSFFIGESVQLVLLFLVDSGLVSDVRFVCNSRVSPGRQNVHGQFVF